VTTTTGTVRTELVQAADATLEVVRGGEGQPMLVLHDELGYAGWLDSYAALARHRTLLVPSHPGFGGSPRLPWIASVRDLAGFYLAALDDLGLTGVDVVGLSLGGWVAAAMATMCPHQFRRMVLVAPAGVRPPTGEIYDQFVVTTEEAIAAGFLDPDNTPEYQRLWGGDLAPERRELREVAREEACRLTWRPYMHDPSLPHLLRRRMPPTLIVWGREDAVVPLSAGEAYRAAITGSRLEVLDRCGHHPEIERAADFARLVEEFLTV